VQSGQTGNDGELGLLKNGWLVTWHTSALCTTGTIWCLTAFTDTTVWSTYHRGSFTSSCGLWSFRSTQNQSIPSLPMPKLSFTLSSFKSPDLHP